MKLKLLVVGKTVENFIKTANDEYQKRIKKYIKFDYVELKDIKVSAKMDFKTVKRLEGELINQNIKPNDFLILLDEHGKQYTSIEFSNYLDNKISTDSRDIVFVIGGPYGFDDSIHQRCDAKISLSKMTFSHQMVRMIFLEQVYRAFTIMKNEPYHHE